MILVDVRQFKFSVLYLSHVQKAPVEIFFIKNLLALQLSISTINTLVFLSTCYSTSKKILIK
jgi:hypothetical protein